jgi:fucose permease
MKQKMTIIFGLLCFATAAILLFNVPRFVEIIIAVFWLGSGLFAFYAAEGKHLRKRFT